MGDVYITQTGTKYHARTDMKCLESAHGFRSVDLATAAAGGLTPCIGCGAPPLPDTTAGDARWLRTVDAWQRAGRFESMWERSFAVKVLSRVPGLDADSVDLQEYLGPENFKVDFYIPQARLVLEIDGFAKDGSVMTAGDLERRNRRDASLLAQGYRVMHFSNHQVSLEEDDCVARIHAVLVESRNQPPEPERLITGVQPVSSVTSTYSSDVMPPPAGRSGTAGLWIAVAGGIVGLVVLIGIIIAVNAGSGPSPEVPTPQVAPLVTVSSPVPTMAGAVASALPINGVCNPDVPLKGNINDKGDKIVHSPGQQYYTKVKAEMCFATLQAAEAEGFRPSKV